LKAHFKNCIEVCAVIKGMKLERAKSYLENVLEKREAVPFRKSVGARGRHAQAKNMKVPGSVCGWPVGAVRFVRDLLKNAESNADSKALDTSSLYVSHAAANAAPKGRRRTFRAHGRINAYLSHPAHIELFLTAKPEAVEKADDSAAKVPRLFKRRLAATQRVPVGGGAAQ
jgi:large subunit ribosomal protein L17e